jgi:hypothetical protein
MSRRALISINDQKLGDNRLFVMFDSDNCREDWSGLYEDEELDNMAQDISNWLRNILPT